jgi:hypothetical protein
LSFARITYTPFGGSPVSVDFTEELSEWSGPLRNASRQVNETEGGVFMVHFGHFTDECVAVIDKMPVTLAFLNAIIAFWGYAARGARFSFARDSSKVGATTVRVAVAAGATLIPVVSSAAFTVGERVVIESAIDGWQQEAGLISGKDISSAPSITVTNPLIFGWAIGDVVRSEFYFPDCMLADDRWPITEEANGLRMTLRLRFQTFTGRVVAVEPA